jgi:hypothetical protein
MLKWTHLHIVTTKTLISAILAVFLLPLFADFLLRIGFNYSAFKIPILGGFVYLITYSIYSYLRPKILHEYPNKEDYVDWAINNNINIFSDLTTSFSISREELKSHISKESLFLYPPERGLDYSRKECIKLYASIEYDLLNASMSIPRYFLTGLVLISIFMINWLAIDRVLRVLGVE